jgi:hypothetical protein
VDGLQAIANIGQSASDYDAHGVVEIGALHFYLDVDLVNTVSWSGRVLFASHSPVLNI